MFKGDFVVRHTGACLSISEPALAARSLICGNLLPGFPLPFPVTLLLLLLAQLSVFAVSILLCLLCPWKPFTGG